VGEALELYASFYRSPADPRALADRLGLGPVLHQPFGTLSGGQRQRLSIALALVGDPEVAVLDELTTGLDPQARRDTWELIEGERQRGVTIVLVSHFMDEAERLCDRLYVVDRGVVVATGTPAELVAATHGTQELRFRTTAPQPRGHVRALLEALPTVRAVREAADGVVVTGSADVVTAVVLALAGHGIAVVDVSASVGTLEDAYVRLTSGAHPAPVTAGAGRVTVTEGSR
jgi:ABC-2 type transport system ATP-binding protein